MISAWHIDGPIAMNPEDQDQPCRRRGAAIVELALAMLLMMGLLAFILFVCQFLISRNQVLAASRTMAWMYAHQQELNGYEGDDVASLEEMQVRLRLWHFKDSGPGAGLVSLKNAHSLGSGIMYKGGGDDLNADMGAAASALLDGEAGKAGNVGEAGARLGPVMEALVGGFLALIGQNFNYHEVQVGYGMPLIFPREAYEKFWGGTTFKIDDLSKDPEFAEQGPRAGATYAFLNPAHAGKCVYPDLNADTSDVLGPLMGVLKGFMEALQSLMKESVPLYRPHMPKPKCSGGGGGDAQVTQNQLEALLIYEIAGYDQDQNDARSRAGIDIGLWNWLTSLTPWWR